MSEFHVEAVKIGEVRPHPNADNPDPAQRCDNLNITRIYGSFEDQSGYPVLFKKGDFKEGDTAVYVPVDAVVPDTDQWSFLAPKGVQVGSVPTGDRRIKARRMRGVFSMGLLAPAPAGVEVGDDVAELMGITRYEPKDPSDRNGIACGDNEASPKGWTFPHYTDIEPLRKNYRLLQVGERVIAREKVHGMNFRAVHDGERLWVGSHERIKRLGGDDPWNKVAVKYNLADVLAQYPMHVVYGEVYGCDENRNCAKIQDLTYNSSELKLAVFDICQLDSRDTRDNRYLDEDDFRNLAVKMGLPIVPVLYDGPWDMHVQELCEGTTIVGDSAHVREGFVVRPAKERRDDRIGRVILKMIGEGYHMRPAGKHASAEDKAKRNAAKEQRRADRIAQRATLAAVSE